MFALLLAGMVLAAMTVARMPETSARRPGALASLAPRVGIPPRLRADVYAILPILVASWALAGLYLALGPSVAAGLFGLRNHLVGGLVVTLLRGAGAATVFLLRVWPADRALRVGAVLLTAGTGLRHRLSGLQRPSCPGWFRQRASGAPRHGVGVRSRRRRARPDRAGGAKPAR